MDAIYFVSILKLILDTSLEYFQMYITISTFMSLYSFAYMSRSQFIIFSSSLFQVPHESAATTRMPRQSQDSLLPHVTEFHSDSGHIIYLVNSKYMV